MKIDVEYFIEEPRSEQDLIDLIEQREYAKVQKRLRLICYLFQYLVPTLFVTILMMR